MAKAKKKPNKPSNVEKLDKLFADPKLHAPTGPMVTSVKVFTPIVEMCRHYLKANGFSENARNYVAGMAFAFRQEAMRRFKHDTAETFLLAELVRTKLPTPEGGRRDAISHINSHSNPMMHLNTDEMEAVEHIQQVWRAFSKGLSGGSRDYSRQGGGSGQNLHPLDTMGENLWKHWKTVYSPWYKEASTIGIARKQSGEPAVSLAQIVLAIVHADTYPEEIDKNYGMRPGRALNVLKIALSCYHNPKRLKPMLTARPKPKQAKNPARTEANTKGGAVGVAPKP